MKKLWCFFSQLLVCLSVFFCCTQESHAADSCKPYSFDGAFMVFSFECFNDQVMVVPNSSRRDAYGWQYIKDNKFTPSLPDNDGLTNGGILDPAPGEPEFEIYGVAFKETATEIYIAIGSKIGLNGSYLSDAFDGHIGWGDILISFNPGSANFSYQGGTLGSLYGIHFVPDSVTSDSGANYKGVYKNVKVNSVAHENKGFTSLFNYMSQVQHQGGTVGLGDINPFIYDDNKNGIYSDDNPNVVDPDEFYSPNISSNVISTGTRITDITHLTLTQINAQGFNQSKLAGSIIAFKFQKAAIVDQCGVFGGDGSTCRDCAGVSCGTAVKDQCGVCNGNNSCLDCAGTPYGNKVVDQCGVCGGNNSCLDCAGTPWGNKTYDQCGVCGGNNSSCKDCTGTINGGETYDVCGVCGGDGTSCRDCAGTINGTKTVDQCGVCGGNGQSCVDCSGTPYGTKVIDQCGVCGGNNSTCKDCAGVPYGGKVVDQCGVCGGNNSTCADCSGTPNGHKTVDQCGVCGGNNSTCKDCSGVPNGGATIDLCGVCGGDNSTCKDCKGVPNGGAVKDGCGVCGGSGPDATGCCPGDTHNSYGQACCSNGEQKDQCGVCGGNGTSCIDCSGTPFGHKTVDQCGVCGGNGQSCLDCSGTPYGTKVKDQCGVCGGDGSSCKDCDSMPFGEKTVDRCGVCGGDGTSCLDCAGIPNGDTTVDECGICGGDGADGNGCCPGDTTNDAGQNCCSDGSAKDVCGECGGDGKSCLDCSGVPFGNKTVDNCGVCGGDGTSCSSCSSVNITETQYILDGTGLEQRLLLKKVLNKVKRSAPNKKKIMKFVDNLMAQGEELYILNWEFIWSIPSVLNQCQNKVFCVTQSNTAQVFGYEKNADTFFKLQKKAVRKLKKLTGKPSSGKRFLKRGRDIIQRTDKLLETIPLTTDVCS